MDNLDSIVAILTIASFLSATLSKAWAMSDSSPDGVSGNKSSKTWATASANSASGAATYASNASTSAANAKTSETNAKTSETNAAASDSAAAASARTQQVDWNSTDTSSVAFIKDVPESIKSIENSSNFRIKRRKYVLHY